MKKIENIIDNCQQCRACQRYVHSQEGLNVGVAFICSRTSPSRLIATAPDPARIEFPDWCPLEIYRGAPSAPSTIILPGMPGLEWMTENLSGFGGTEVDGRWYYTYNEAVAAVKQLGNGWRLMTRGEAVDLAALGSIWQEGGPHGLPGRLFGGGLFLEASGYRDATTGALANVGTSGYSLSSSPLAADQAGMGYLYFSADDVSPLGSWYRSAGFPVRCVRNVK